MTLATAPARLTPEDLDRLSDEGSFELVNGRLVEKPMSKASNATANWFACEFGNYLRRNPIAVSYIEQPFTCFPVPGDDDRTRKPDVAVVLHATAASDAANPIVFSVRPDIAVEVVSPTDGDVAYDLREKLDEYRAAGVPLVFVAYPNTRSVEVHRDGQPVGLLGPDDTLTADPVLPGFAVRVADLFPLPATGNVAG